MKTKERLPSEESKMLQEYETHYRSNHEDSPELSRSQMALDIRRIVNAGLPRPLIVNLGSGTQLLEKMLLKWDNQRFQTLHQDIRFITLDRARILSKRLLARTIPNVLHLRADGANVPLIDESVGLVVSNMALDFMPREAFHECYRILAPGGTFLANLHHPNMLPNDLTTIEATHRKNFWQYLREKKKIFAHAQAIKKKLEKLGFEEISVTERNSFENWWWEVKAKKPQR